MLVFPLIFALENFTLFMMFWKELVHPSQLKNPFLLLFLKEKWTPNIGRREYFSSQPEI